MTYRPIDLSEVDDLPSLTTTELAPLALSVATDIIIAAETALTRAELGRLIGAAFENHGRALAPMQRSRWAAKALEQFAEQVGEFGAINLEKVRASMLGRHERLAARFELAMNRLLPSTAREFARMADEDLRPNVSAAVRAAQALVAQDRLRAELLHLDKLAPETVLHDPQTREVILDMLARQIGDFDDEQRARLAAMASAPVASDGAGEDPLTVLKLV